MKCEVGCSCMRESVAADPGVVDAAGESKSIADAEMKADADVMLGVSIAFVLTPARWAMPAC